jgi:hypothetical protein
MTTKHKHKVYNNIQNRGDPGDPPSVKDVLIPDEYITQGVGYNIGSASNEQYALLAMDQHKFIKRLEAEGKEIFAVNFKLKNYFKSSFAMLETVRAVVPDTVVVMTDESYMKLTRNDIFIIAYYHNNAWSFNIVGSNQEACINLKEELGKDDTKVQLSWWFKTDEGYFDDHRLEFTFNQTAEDAYYPFIKEGLGSYLKAYKESESPILLFMGEPGSGKTSLLKHFMKEYKLNTVVTYDSDVMKSDYFYIQYLIDNNKHLMVIEDADLLLSSREDDGNKTMTKLLNLSDGLIKLENKKIIFTTNLTQLRKIDGALIRPGRCFDVMEFRKLSFAEAKEACRVAGVSEVAEDREYCLSEIFNRRELSVYRSKVGFGI